MKVNEIKINNTLFKWIDNGASWKIKLRSGWVQVSKDGYEKIGDAIKSFARFIVS